MGWVVTSKRLTLGAVLALALALILVIGCTSRSRVAGIIQEFSGAELPGSVKLLVQQEEWNEVNGDGHAYYVFEFPDSALAKNLIANTKSGFKKSSYADVPRKPMEFKKFLKPQDELHYKLELKGQDFTLLILKEKKLLYFSSVS